MYRLQTKFSPIAIVAILIFAAATVVFPKQEMFKGSYHFHCIVLPLIEIGVSLIAAFVLFDRGSIVHKYKVCITIIAFSCFYGTLANVLAYSWKINPGMDLEFSTAQLVLMNLGGILTALTLYKLEPIDAFSDGGLDRLQRANAESSGPDSLGGAEELAAKAVMAKALDDSPKSSVSKLRGMSQSESTTAKESKPAETTSPEAEKKTPYTSPPQVEIDLEASDEMLSGPLNPNPQSSSAVKSQDGAVPAAAEPSSTGNRIQSARRRNTSTFTKLQALSASGTGSVTAPQPTATEGSGDLKSLLDRLDTDEEDTTEAKPATEPTKEPIPAQDLIAEPIKEETAASSTPAMQKESYGAPIEVNADYLFDLLDKPTAKPIVEAPKPVVHEEPKPEPKPAIVAQAPLEEPVSASPKLESLLDRAEANIDETDTELKEKTPEPSSTDAKETSPDADLDSSTSNLLSQRFAELTDEDEKVEESVSKEEEVEVVVVVEDKGVESVSTDQAEKVFDDSVDSEIDDIFTTLAPEDAQKEVSKVPSPKEEPEPEAKSDVEDAEKLFDQDVGSEIDDIFTSLAPEEAQRTVEESSAEKPKEEIVAQKDSDESQEEDSEKIFKLQDDDVDDIFAGLTTEEQKDVDSTSLEKVKEKSAEEIKAEQSKITRQTGEMPALNATQAKKIREEATKPGKFSETLSKIPSLKNTVEGLLQSLEEEQSGSDDDSDEEYGEIDKVESLTDEQQAAHEVSKKLKDFGRLSGKVVSAKTSEAESQGTMKTIGKLLIDKQAVEKIIQSGETKELGKGLSNARVISAARGKGISDLLTKIDEYDGVAGSIVVGHDGLVMASTLRDGWDKDMMGALSTALLSTSNLTTKKLEIGKLRQMVMLTQDNGQAKTTVLTDVDVGILGVFLEETDVAKIDGLLVTIQETIHG